MGWDTGVHAMFCTPGSPTPNSQGPAISFGVYPLVNIQKAIEHGHRNSGFSHEKCWFSIAMLVHQRVAMELVQIYRKTLRLQIFSMGQKKEHQIAYWGMGSTFSLSHFSGKAMERNTSWKIVGWTLMYDHVEYQFLDHSWSLAIWSFAFWNIGLPVVDDHTLEDPSDDPLDWWSWQKIPPFWNVYALCELEAMA